MTVTVLDVVRFLIENGPGRSEAQIAEAIFGADGYPQRVNQECRMLVNSGVVQRSGLGGPADPFRYFPKG